MGPLNVPLCSSVSRGLPPLLTRWPGNVRNATHSETVSRLSSPLPVKHHKPSALTRSTHKMRIITSLLFPLCHFGPSSAQTLPNLGGAT